MDMSTSTCSCVRCASGVDFECRCCSQWVQDGERHEFRDGCWICKRCYALIELMDEDETRARQAFEFMSTTIAVSRWDR